jgi:hypothetical protein
MRPAYAFPVKLRGFLVSPERKNSLMHNEDFVCELKRLLGQWKVSQTRHMDKARSDPTERLWAGIALATKACRTDLERLIARLERGDSRGPVSIAEAMPRTLEWIRSRKGQGHEAVALAEAAEEQAREIRAATEQGATA